MGVEPTRPKALEPKSSASANSAKCASRQPAPQERAGSVIDSLAPAGSGGKLAELRSNSTSRSYRTRTDDLLGVNQMLWPTELTICKAR